jgi:hypothetical protein
MGGGNASRGTVDAETREAILSAEVFTAPNVPAARLAISSPEEELAA